MTVEKREVFDEVGAGAVQRGGGIEQVSQAIGRGGDEPPAGSQADKRVAALAQGQGPEAPRQHQRHTQERCTHLEQAAAEHGLDQFQGYPAALQLFDGRQQGRGVERVGRHEGHDGFTCSC
ncbi:hypothetical protein D9M71_625860 [compost metagenome]